VDGGGCAIWFPQARNQLTAHLISPSVSLCRVDGGGCAIWFPQARNQLATHRVKPNLEKNIPVILSRTDR
jgi:sarcosine oxidase delta subunit